MNDSHSSRRGFLTTSALAAAALAASERAAAAAAAGTPGHAERLSLGLASYSTRKLTLDETLELGRELAIRHIHLKDVHLPMTASASDFAAARAKIEAAGMRLMGGGTITLKNDPAQVRAAFEYAKAAGFPLIVAAPEPAAFDMIERAIREFDVKVAVHNHGPEDKHFPAPQDAYRLLNGRDARFGLCMDIGHASRAGVDPVTTVAEVKDRLLDIHVKDLKDKLVKESQTEVGKGALDIPGLFRALVGIGFEGHVALEYEINEANPRVGIRESLAYMRGVLDTL
jgi:sugar phosphate isomerase/epimerase